MTSNKEFISQTKENLTKLDAAIYPQLNSDDGSFRQLFGIKEDKTVLPSIYMKASFPLIQKPNLKIEVSK